MDEQHKPWITRMLDDGEKIGPVASVIGAGILGFVVVLGSLAWWSGQQSLYRFSALSPFQETEVMGQEEVLQSLSAEGRNTVSEEDKMRTLKSLSERIDNGEERIMLSEQQKLDVLASLRSAE